MSCGTRSEPENKSSASEMDREIHIAVYIDHPKLTNTDHSSISFFWRRNDAYYDNIFAHARQICENMSVFLRSVAFKVVSSVNLRY